MTRQRITTVPATLSLSDVCERPWDVIVIGAGVAGALAAREAARRSLRVLLVDRCVFPRWKVCGCCLNLAALQVLKATGLAHLPQDLGAQQLREFRLACGGRTARVPLSGGVAVTREQLDAAIIQAAVESGAEFLDATQALARPNSLNCDVQLKRNNEARDVSCKLVIVASGLGARCFAGDTDEHRESSRHSRIGAATIVNAPMADYPVGAIHMACDRGGYVGLVRVEDGRLEIAAALDSMAIKQCGGVGPAAQQIIQQSGLPPIQELADHDWHGTARLTQRRKHVGGDGYLVIGDAAGYVEPFTGEGIAWALATGSAIAEFAVQSVHGDAVQAARGWARAYQRLVRRRMWICRGVSFILRRPWLVAASVWALQRQPRLVLPLQRWLNAPYVTEV